MRKVKALLLRHNLSANQRPDRKQEILYKQSTKKREENFRVKFRVASLNRLGGDCVHKVQGKKGKEKTSFAYTSTRT